MQNLSPIIHDILEMFKGIIISLSLVSKIKPVHCCLFIMAFCNYVSLVAGITLNALNADVFFLWYLLKKRASCGF